MTELNQKKCVPCEEGGTPLSENDATDLLKQVPDWKLNDKKIERKFEFDDFKHAMKFVNKIADVAENEGHHPDIYIHYNIVHLVLWTHEMDGLSENDFVMAAKIDDLTL